MVWRSSIYFFLQYMKEILGDKLLNLRHTKHSIFSDVLASEQPNMKTRTVCRKFKLIVVKSSGILEMLCFDWCTSNTLLNLTKSSTKRASCAECLRIPPLLS